MIASLVMFVDLEVSTLHCLHIQNAQVYGLEGELSFHYDPIISSIFHSPEYVSPRSNDVCDSLSSNIEHCLMCC